KKRTSNLLTKRKTGTNGRKFSDRTERFVENMADPSIKSHSQAAREAGYSAATAAQAASRLLTNVKVREAIEKRKAEAAEYHEIKPETIVGGAIRQMTATIDDCLDDTGHFDIGKARATGAIDLVKTISWTKSKYGENVRLEMYPADSARQEVARYIGLEQKPRENQNQLKKLAHAARQYLIDFPEAELAMVQDFFSRGSGIPVELIIEEMEKVQ
ncbi:MAG: terminase small subunit, partial [Acidobacteriota bacterium]